MRKLPLLQGQKSNPNPKFIGTAEAYFPPVDLHWFFEISIRTEKKIQLEQKKIQLVYN